MEEIMLSEIRKQISKEIDEEITSEMESLGIKITED